MEREDAISALNEAIKSLDPAKGVSGIVPAKVVFDSVNVILVTTRVGFLPVFVDRV